MDTTAVIAALCQQRIETPSWGYANSGTRFGTFAQPAAARTLDEKLEDAAEVHRLTGICPTVALHIPWDRCDDWGALKKKAAGLGIRIGAINPNVFQDPCYARGSLGNPDAAVRAKAVAHVKECIAIATATGSECISLWFADGTNYPGQDDFRARKRRFEDGLREVYATLTPSQRLLVEYKCFEPAFYHTDLADWGTSLLMCQKLGPQAQVLVDTGHHLPGANIEHIVALLLDEGRLGGFHFNGRKYADDDLTLGSINPYELFLIFCETVKGAQAADARVKTCAERIAYMFDHSLVDKPKIAATIQSVMIAQEACAKALLVDQKALAAAQERGDIVGAEEVLKDAFATDVRPLLAQVRAKLGVPENPLQAWRASGGEAKRASEREARHGKAKAGGGFQ